MSCFKTSTSMAPESEMIRREQLDLSLHKDYIYNCWNLSLARILEVAVLKPGTINIGPERQPFRFAEHVVLTPGCRRHLINDHMMVKS